jgi:hypothetical protein
MNITASIVTRGLSLNVLYENGSNINKTLTAFLLRNGNYINMINDSNPSYVHVPINHFNF